MYLYVKGRRGIVFSIEAAMAATVFLALIAILYSFSQDIRGPDLEMQSCMRVAHDMVMDYTEKEQLPSLPEGYSSPPNCNKSVYVFKVSDTDGYHAEVCMK